MSTYSTDPDDYEYLDDGTLVDGSGVIDDDGEDSTIDEPSPEFDD